MHGRTPSPRERGLRSTTKERAARTALQVHSVLQGRRYRWESLCKDGVSGVPPPPRCSSHSDFIGALKFQQKHQTESFEAKLVDSQHKFALRASDLTLVRNKNLNRHHHSAQCSVRVFMQPQRAKAANLSRVNTVVTTSSAHSRPRTTRWNFGLACSKNPRCDPLNQ